MRANIHTRTFTRIVSAALIIIAQKRKQYKCPSTGEWIKKIRYHTIECYLAMKERNEHDMTWISLKHMLSERSQT